MKYYILAMLFTVSVATSQRLEGIVLGDNQTPLQDVSIINQNNGLHAHSNSNGKFSIAVGINDSIYFSSLGFAAKTLVVTSTNIITKNTVYLKPASIALEQVVLVSKVDVLSTLAGVDLENSPVKSSQEILRKVPGLILGQHAGGGKAEQIFLRGFDIDHGTDIALSVDGLPVNMVSHAHGQGYADLHFVIPETVANINFGKGPFYAQQGNFNTAGFVDLRLRKSIDKSIISLELGDFNTQRLLGMFPILENKNSTAYIASELYLTDGPLESPQNFNRINIMGRYNYKVLGDQELVLTASHFQSRWDASGQIPQRAVDQNIIGRFGAIDDTEGGTTSRTNLLVNHTKTLEKGVVKSKAYASYYDFELYSNFTFFLNDPINGDQIKQREERVLVGGETVYSSGAENATAKSIDFQTGIGFRYDDSSENELSSTLNRQTIIDRIAFGDVDELNTYGFFNASYKTGAFIINPAIRLDYFKFNYLNRLSEVYDYKSEDKVAFSPKLNINYSPNLKTQYFLKSGIGFHSNDARVVVANSGESILPAAYGLDLGVLYKPFKDLIINATAWSLFLEQEFVYVGDAGIVEPSGKTRRLGVELGARFQATDWFYIHADANYTYGRSIEEPKGAQFIPLAPDITATGGFSIQKDNISAGLNYRYIDDRPANEDNSIVAEGYFVTDATVSYTRKNWTVGIIVENMFNTEWNETQFATESRLFNESASVEEIHFTPGMPFYVRAKLSVTF